MSLSQKRRHDIAGTPAQEIAAYIRVSSRAQDHATQRDAIERAAKNRGEKVGRWFAEKRSAKTMERPELAELRRVAAAGEVRKLYVFRLDRLARSGIRDTLALVHELKALGVELVTIADGFDVSGPAWEIIAAVMAWAAQMERLATNERISAARERIETEGRRWGRPPRLSEFERNRVVEAHARGLSVRTIARNLKIPRSTVARTLAS
jgi:DNA invertase Pin-like site-specific DNA recombinase